MYENNLPIAKQIKVYESNFPIAKQTEVDEMPGKMENLFSFVTFGWFTFKLTGCNIDCWFDFSVINFFWCQTCALHKHFKGVHKGHSQRDRYSSEYASVYCEKCRVCTMTSYCAWMKNSNLPLAFQSGKRDEFDKSYSRSRKFGSVIITLLCNIPICHFWLLVSNVYRTLPFLITHIVRFTISHYAYSA